MIEFRIGDVFARLAEIPDGSIDLVVTSPPFLALRSYLPADHPDKHLEIGSEATPADFLDTLLALTAEWGRVLAPHGSICVELGDTFSGSGQSGWERDTGEYRRENRSRVSADGRLQQVRDTSVGWPLAKSLTGIPTLYTWSLAYGRNLLTGQPSPAGQWRIRNVIVWARPNPPVGALGDKFRPATSYITVACKSAKRYFDLDAVRGVSADPVGRGAPNGDGRNGDPGRYDSNPAGAPPLDWHTDNHPEDGDWLWKLPTQPYRGSHYAVYPEALPRRLIGAMCPQRVCVVCGRPSERIAETTNAVGRRPDVSPRSGRFGMDTDAVGVRYDLNGAPDRAERVTLGWTDCGHGSYRCTSCHVVVPLDHAVQRSREGARSETEVGSEALLVEPGEGAGGSTEHAGDVRAVRNRVHGTTGRKVLHPELFGETGARRGASERDPAEDADARTEGQPSGIREGLGSEGDTGPTEEWLHDGASTGDAGPSRPPAGAVGTRPSSKRREGRQPDRESGSGDAGTPCGNGDVPELSASLPGELKDGYVCPCGSRDVEYVADHYRTGVVLDPFAGSGTTLAVSLGVGRHAIGVDLDARNADLARDRVGMFLTVDHGTEAGAA